MMVCGFDAQSLDNWPPKSRRDVACHLLQMLTAAYGPSRHMAPPYDLGR
jgi:hypothetical protein